MSESTVRDLLMKQLFERVGTVGSWSGSDKSASFRIDRLGFVGQCTVEGVLTYCLPDGTSLDHKSDIQISYRRRSKSDIEYISIEVKHESAVTDQFKARAFDISHMKQEFGARLHGIIVFARMGQGVGLERAKAISYSFDDFVGADLLKGDIVANINQLGRELATRIEAVLSKAG